MLFDLPAGSRDMTNQPRPLPPPSAYPAPPAVPRVEGLAVASLVLGIVWAYWIGSAAWDWSSG